MPDVDVLRMTTTEEFVFDRAKLRRAGILDTVYTHPGASEDDRIIELFTQHFGSQWLETMFYGTGNDDTGFELFTRADDA